MSGRILSPTVPKLVFMLFVLSLAAVSLPGITRQSGQSQDQPSSDAQSQSIADAARRSREQAKNATKTSKVITDDDLDKKRVTPGAQGLTVDAPAKLETQPPTAEAVAAAVTATSSSTAPATTPAPSDDPEIAKLKDSIAEAEKDADLLKRDLTLQQDTHFSNPDHEHDTAGKAKLDSLQQQIDTKQQNIDGLKTRLAAMQDLHRTPPPPAQPNQPAAPAVPSQP